VIFSFLLAEALHFENHQFQKNASLNALQLAFWIVQMRALYFVLSASWHRPCFALEPFSNQQFI